MARSSILGTSPAPAEPAGRDTAALGPGDSSDSGSDMMGIADSAGGDPGVPADIGADDEQRAGPLSSDALHSPSDAAGTGESRSAGGDAGEQDGWDIGVDRVFTPGSADEEPELTDAEDALIEEALTQDGPGDDEDEDDEEEDDDTEPPGPPAPVSPPR